MSGFDDLWFNCEDCVTETSHEQVFHQNSFKK